MPAELSSPCSVVIGCVYHSLLCLHCQLRQFRGVHALAGAGSDEHLDIIDGSALLDLQGLKVLRAGGWHIRFAPGPAPKGAGSVAPLALTELETSTWRKRGHNGLLYAAVRGGAASCLWHK